MIYRGQFGDYNNNLYKVEFYKHLDNETRYALYAPLYPFDTFTEDRTITVDGFDDYGNASLNMDAFMPRSLPDGKIYFTINTEYISGISIGDELEIKFSSMLSLGADIQKAKYCYGVKFGKFNVTTTDNVTTYTLPDGIKIKNYNLTEYSYTTTITESNNLIGFLIDKPNCNSVSVKNITIINNTQGTAFDVLNDTSGWCLKNKYPSDNASLGELTFSYATDYADGWTTPDGQSTNINCGSVTDSSGIYYRAYTPSDNSTVYTVDYNTDYRYPNIAYTKNIYLPKGEYMIDTSVMSAEGGGLMFKFKSEGETVASYEIPGYQDGRFHSLTFNITLGKDCDEIFFGNEDETLFCNKYCIIMPLLYKKVEDDKIYYTVPTDGILTVKSDGNLSCNFTSDTNNVGSGMYYGEIVTWFNTTIPRSMPDGKIYFTIDTEYFEGINIDDELEITFIAVRSMGWAIQDFKHFYGIKFGKFNVTMDDDGTITLTLMDDAIDVNTRDTIVEYSYTTTITDSNTVFGFDIDASPSYNLNFGQMTIINKTQGTSFDILDYTNGWHLADYYPSDNASLGELTYTYPTDYPNGAWTTPDGKSATVSWGESTDGQFCGGVAGDKFQFVYTYSNWDTNYWVGASPNNINTDYRFPNVEYTQSVYLPKGEYKLNFDVISAFGGGLMLKFKSEGETIASYEIPAYTDENYHNITTTITLDRGCDEIFFGNEDGSLFAAFYKLRDFKLTRKEDNTYSYITEITLGGTPFTVELEGDTDDLFKPIKTSTATATIVTEEYLYDLYSNTNDIDVALYDKDDNIKWLGIVKPLIFNMGYNQKLEEIEIECIDYLEMLDSIYLTDLDIIKNRPIMTFGDLFAKILNEHTKYKYLYYPEIYNFDMLETYSVSTSNFIDKECRISGDDLLYADKNWSLKKILEEMCKYMGLTLVADGERVMLLPYLHLQYNITYKEYYIREKLVFVAQGLSDLSRISADYLYDNSDLELLPVLNKFTCTTKTNKVEELIPDFLDDDNLTNITGGEETATYNSSEQTEDTIDDKKYNAEFKFFKCNSNKVTNYSYTQVPTPVSMMSYVQSSIAYENNYPKSISDLNYYTGGIIGFSSKEIPGEDETTSEFKSSDTSSYQKYYVLSKGSDVNLNYMAIGNPVLRLESDVMNFNNKMALKISGSMIQVPYRRDTNHQWGISDFYTRWPIERDDLHFKLQTSDDKQAYQQTDMFCNIGMTVRVGGYYFHNCGMYFENKKLQSVKHFFRKGWWDTTPVFGMKATRLQFDNESNEWAWGKRMSVTDNSGDSDINQDSSGYWILFNANESQGEYETNSRFNGPTAHVDLPEHFTGKVEICLYPNSIQGVLSIDRYVGDLVQFLSDFKVELVVPRDMSMTEDEWNSETEISAIVDATSFQKGQEVTCELHSDFGKSPAYSTVIGASDYNINNVGSETHCAEEWIVFNYTKQYSEIRKILNTSLKEDQTNEIRPNSIVEIKNSDNFTKMMVDSFKKDYKTGYTEVKLVEICDL